jgi:acyl carrier protein
MSDLATSLRQFISDNFLFGVETDFGDHESFLELGIIDSTGVLELIAHIESTHGLDIDDDELLPENLDSIDNLTRFIKQKQCAVS